jgi:hypothetical protein
MKGKGTMPDIAEVLEKAPRDCWLALAADQSKVVGRGENIEEAVAAAKENGEDDPVLILAPKKWVPAVY